MSYVVSFMVSVVLIFNLAGLAYAEQSTNSAGININYESTNPNQGLQYGIKRVKEKIRLLLSFSSESKITYYQVLLKVRLAELKYVVDNRDIADIETTTQRYSSTVGELTDLVINNQLDNRKQETKDLLLNQLKVVDALKGSYDNTTAEWRFVENDSNYLKIYISKLD